MFFIVASWFLNCKQLLASTCAKNNHFYLKLQTVICKENTKLLFSFKNTIKWALKRQRGGHRNDVDG